jgi:hypothetical protein
MPQLQRLECSECGLRAEGVRAFQPGLRSNRTLREMCLRYCNVGDNGTRLLADACWSEIQLLKLLESTRLKKISPEVSRGVFGNEASTRRFVSCQDTSF